MDVERIDWPEVAEGGEGGSYIGLGYFGEGEHSVG